MERRGGCVLQRAEDTCALRQGLSWAGAVDGGATGTKEMAPGLLQQWPELLSGRVPGAHTRPLAVASPQGLLHWCLEDT